MICKNCGKVVPASIYNYSWEMCFECCQIMCEEMDDWIDDLRNEDTRKLSEIVEYNRSICVGGFKL